MQQLGRARDHGAGLVLDDRALEQTRVGRDRGEGRGPVAGVDALLGGVLAAAGTPSASSFAAIASSSASVGGCSR